MRKRSFFRSTTQMIGRITENKNSPNISHFQPIRAIEHDFLFYSIVLHKIRDKLRHTYTDGVRLADVCVFYTSDSKSQLEIISVSETKRITILTPAFRLV